MSDIKKIVSVNINKLRTKHHMTQMDLADRLHYSDKAVSKWERGESLPDISVLKSIGEVFGVSVDYLLSVHDTEEEKPQYQAKEAEINYKIISMISIIGVWALALLIFLVLYWSIDIKFWSVFVYILPVNFILLLIFNCIWGEKMSRNFWFVSGIVWSILLVIYNILLEANLWQLALLGIIAEVLIFLSFKIKKKP